MQMHKKPYRHCGSIIQNVLPAVLLSLCISIMAGIAYGQTCGNALCETGEDTTSCVYDCMVSTLQKDVKLFRAYNTDYILHYRNDGTKELITDIAQVKNFLLQHINFSVYGIVGVSDRLYNETHDFPVLYYRDPTHCNDIRDPIYYAEPTYNEFIEYDQNHEDWFVHDPAASTDNKRRVQTRYAGDWLYNPLAAGWIDRYVEWTGWYLHDQTYTTDAGTFQDRKSVV